MPSYDKAFLCHVISSLRRDAMRASSRTLPYIFHENSRHVKTLLQSSSYDREYIVCVGAKGIITKTTNCLMELNLKYLS